METENSTPVEQTDTSSSFEPEKSDTSNVEPETKAAEKLLAGKYKTVEELEKGYYEAQKSVSKASEYEKKYNELVNLNYKTKQAEEINNKRSQIVKQVQFAELQVFKDNLKLTSNPQEASVLLSKFEQTQDVKYLKDAKKYFPAQFLEDAAVAKTRYQQILSDDFQNQISQMEDSRIQNLTKSIVKKFPDFLSDINENEAKKETLGTLLQSGVINSIEDMKIFENIYSKVIKQEREAALQEYEATNAINNAKAKSKINTGITNFSTVENPPTYSQLSKMSQDEFNQAYQKFGLEAILNAE